MLYTEEYSPTSAAASIWMLLATGTAKDGELRNLDAEQTFLKVDIDEEIFIEIPGEYEELLEVVRLLSKVIYGLVKAGRCWNNKVCDDMTEIEFEQSTADPCVLRKFADEEVEMLVIVHMHDILSHAQDQATMEKFATELERTFRLKNMGDPK